MNIYIILGIIWLAISETIYICFCKDSTKKEVKEEGALYKTVSMVMGLVITLDLHLLYFVFKNYTNYALIGLGIIISLFLFFYINYKIGISVAKKDVKTKRKTKKRS